MGAVFGAGTGQPTPHRSLKIRFYVFLTIPVIFVQSVLAVNPVMVRAYRTDPSAHRQGLFFPQKRSPPAVDMLSLPLCLAVYPWQSMQERLQKILSQWGIASRRHAEQTILDGRVRVNGKPVSVGDKADPQRDRIEVDGTVLHPQQRPQLLYLLLNKPLGVVCTCSDPAGRQTVLDLLPQQLRQGQGLHPVGRLDVDSTGALILTNDGDLTFRLTHPRHELPKTYSVWVKGFPTPAALQKWRQGVRLSVGKTQPARVEVLKKDRKKGQTLLRVTIREGKNRQIRRIGDRLGYPVVRLHRTAIGNIRLTPPPPSPQKPYLPPGAYRFLSDGEVAALKHR